MVELGMLLRNFLSQAIAIKRYEIFQTMKLKHAAHRKLKHAVHRKVNHMYKSPTEEILNGLAFPPGTNF